jgi:hypothetical protein
MLVSRLAQKKSSECDMEKVQTAAVLLVRACLDNYNKQVQECRKSRSCPKWQHTKSDTDHVTLMFCQECQKIKQISHGQPKDERRTGWADDVPDPEFDR